MKVAFDSWAQLLDHIAAGYPLWYHAPMDYHPAQVTVHNVYKNGKLRVYPIYADADPFTADESHLSRFRRADSNATQLAKGRS